MSWFVKLTLDDGSDRPLDIRPEAIDAIEADWSYGQGAITARVHIQGCAFNVQETREQILALLAAPAPAEIQITEAMARTGQWIYEAACVEGMDPLAAWRRAIAAALAVGSTP